MGVFLASNFHFLLMCWGLYYLVSDIAILITPTTSGYSCIIFTTNLLEPLHQRMNSVSIHCVRDMTSTPWQLVRPSTFFLTEAEELLCPPYILQFFFVRGLDSYGINP